VGDAHLKYRICREASLVVAHFPDSDAMLDPMPLSEERLRLDVRVRVPSKIGTGSTSGSLKTWPKASLDWIAMAWSTLSNRSTVRRSPEPMRRSSRACGQVVERVGMEGLVVFDFDSNASGSHRSWSCLWGTWNVSPLRIDMFWKQSSKEGVTEGLTGRRRGCMVVEDMIGKDRRKKRLSNQCPGSW
jgi:hypothetical protein